MEVRVRGHQQNLIYPSTKQSSEDFIKYICACRDEHESKKSDSTRLVFRGVHGPGWPGPARKSPARAHL